MSSHRKRKQSNKDPYTTGPCQDLGFYGWVNYWANESNK